MVDVYVLTYNHEKYITKALDSILMQKVKFKYRILIGDDCSTDNTRKILKKYQKKYPNIINLFFRNKNVGMKENSRLLHQELKAKYVAVIEGDDYWIDEYKLQKQYDFLEKNIDFNAYVSSVYIVDKNNHRDLNLERSYTNYCYTEDRVFTFGDALMYTLPGQSATLMFRNFYLNLSAKQKELFYKCSANGEQKVAIINTLNGKIFCSKNPLAAHRKVFDEGTSWSFQTQGKNMSKFHFNAIRDIEKMLLNGFHQRIDMQDAKNARFRESVIYFKSSKSLEDFKILSYIFVFNKDKKRMLKSIFRSE